MCFDLDSRPPIAPIAGAAVDGRRVPLHSADGTDFAAYAASPSAPTGAAMLILPDVRGLHTFYEELALRFAEAGVASLAIDYFGRTAGTGPRSPDFDHSGHVAQVRWGSLREDIDSALREIRSWPDVRGVFSVGFCFGGRLSLLLASQPALDMSGVIGFYAWPVGESRGGVPAPIDHAEAAQAPLLALFGGADQGIPDTAVDAYRNALAGGAEREVVVYPGAPHSFFDRKASDFADASADAWARILELVKRNTPAA